MNVGNIFFGIPDKIKDELFEEIIRTDRFTLERIISDGNETPKDEWYDQDKDEWVILLKGRAGLMFDGEEGVIQLNPGDYVHIPAHRKHRVEWTTPDEKTVWLAVHY